jgi:hypothetical protein
MDSLPAMTAPAQPPVAKLSTPGDIVASIPVLCGFPPRDSVVLISLRGPRKRVGLTMRLDLPPAALEQEAAVSLAERIAHDGAGHAVVAVFAAQRRGALVEELVTQLEQRGVRLLEALHVHGGRWSSYVCTGSCCPPEGTPVPPVPTLIEAERVLDGRPVLASRQELVQSLAPPVLLARAEADQRIAEADSELTELHLTEGREAWRDLVLAEGREALAHVASGGTVSARSAARLAVALQDVDVRDEMATWALDDSDALLSLVTQVVRRAPPPDDAPACTLLAWVAYERGNGAMVNVALDRALDSDPSYRLALLLQAALDGQLPPSEIRRTMRAGRRRARRR